MVLNKDCKRYFYMLLYFKGTTKLVKNELAIAKFKFLVIFKFEKYVLNFLK